MLGKTQFQNDTTSYNKIMASFYPFKLVKADQESFYTVGVDT